MKSIHRYYPVNMAQQSWGLYATCVGHSLTEPGDEFPSSAHPDEYFFNWKTGRILHEWQFILLEQGRGTVEFRNRRYSAKKGSLLVLPPECWHRYRPNKAEGWTTLWVGCGGKLATDLIAGMGFNPGGDIKDLSRFPSLTRLFSDTVRGIMEQGSDRPHSTAIRILSLIATLVEESSSITDEASNAELISRTQSHIIEHAAETIDFNALAESLGVPYRTLRYLFTKETETSLLQYQLDIRLARAKNLLRSSDMPVAEIAKVLGFNSTWYFTHFFQRRADTSPSSYRKKHRTP